MTFFDRKKFLITILQAKAVLIGAIGLKMLFVQSLFFQALAAHLIIAKGIIVKAGVTALLVGSGLGSFGNPTIAAQGFVNTELLVSPAGTMTITWDALPTDQDLVEMTVTNTDSLQITDVQSIAYASGTAISELQPGPYEVQLQALNTNQQPLGEPLLLEAFHFTFGGGYTPGNEQTFDHGALDQDLFIFELAAYTDATLESLQFEFVGDNELIDSIALYQSSNGINTLIATQPGSLIDGNNEIIFDTQSYPLIADQLVQFFVVVTITDNQSVTGTFEANWNAVTFVANEGAFEETYTVNFSQSGPFNVISQGDLSVAMVPSSTTPQFIIGGETNVPIGSFTLSPSGGQVIIEDLSVNLVEGDTNSIADAITEMHIIDSEGTIIATDIPTSSTVIFNNINLQVNETMTYTLVIDTDIIGENRSGVDTFELKFAISVSGGSIGNVTYNNNGASMTTATQPIIISAVGMEGIQGITSIGNYTIPGSINDTTLYPIGIYEISASNWSNTNSIDGSALNLVIDSLGINETGTPPSAYYRMKSTSQSMSSVTKSNNKISLESVPDSLKSIESDETGYFILLGSFPTVQQESSYTLSLVQGGVSFSSSDDATLSYTDVLIPFEGTTSSTITIQIPQVEEEVDTGGETNTDTEQQEIDTLVTKLETEETEQTKTYDQEITQKFIEKLEQGETQEKTKLLELLDDQNAIDTLLKNLDDTIPQTLLEQDPEEFIVQQRTKNFEKIVKIMSKTEDDTKAGTQRIETLTSDGKTVNKTELVDIIGDSLGLTLQQRSDFSDRFQSEPEAIPVGNAILELETITTADADNDGVVDFVEDIQAGDGDGNDDGTPDSTQADVATIESAERESDLTIDIGQSSACTQLLSFTSTTESSIGTEDDDYMYPFGLNKFRVACDSVTVRVHYHGISNLADMPYRKWSPRQNAYIDMSSIVTYGTSPDGVQYAEFTIFDNSTYDDDLTVGIIVDDNGPAEEIEQSGSSSGGGIASVLTSDGDSHGSATYKSYLNYTPTDWVALRAKLDAMELGNTEKIAAIKDRIIADNIKRGHTVRVAPGTEFIEPTKPSFDRSPTNRQALREKLDGIVSGRQYEKMIKIQAMLIANNQKRASYAKIGSSMHSAADSLQGLLEKPFNRLLSLDFMLKWSDSAVFKGNNVSFFGQLNDMIEGKETQDQAKEVNTILDALESYSPEKLEEMNINKQAITQVLEFMLNEIGYPRVKENTTETVVEKSVAEEVSESVEVTPEEDIVPEEKTPTDEESVDALIDSIVSLLDEE